MENIIKEIENINLILDNEYQKENPNFRKISFYESMLRCLKESYLEEMLS